MKLSHLAMSISFIIVFSISVLFLSYRALVELPDIESNIRHLQNRELSSLKLALDLEFEFLKTMNWDYSIWDDTHAYFLEPSDQQYIESNFGIDTFESLKIDGVFLYDLNGGIVWSKSLDFDSGESEEYPEFDLALTPQNRVVLPDWADSNTIVQKFGFLNTTQGLVMFASTPALHSDRSGTPSGSLLFLRKVRPTLVDKLSTLTQLRLDADSAVETEIKLLSKPLLGDLQSEGIQSERSRYIADIHGSPVLMLKITHSRSADLSLLNQNFTVILGLSLLIPLLLLAVARKIFIVPIVSGAKVIRAMTSSGKLYPLLGHSLVKEISELTRDFNLLIGTVNEQKNRLEEMTLTDGLTGVANRRAFDFSIERSWNSMRRHDHCLVVILIDIDCFKPYNDNYGHLEGDKALTQVATLLDETFARGNDTVARYGGEEFAVVLEDTSLEECKILVEKAMAGIRSLEIKHELSTVTELLTVSMGLAVIKEWSMLSASHSPKSLVDKADQMLYQAKNAGRNRCEYAELRSEEN